MSLAFSVKKKIVYAVVLALVAVYLVLEVKYRWEDNTPPRVSLVEPFTLVGPTTPLVLHVEDTGTGIRNVTVHLVQNLERYTLADEQFPARGGLSIIQGARDTLTLRVVPFGDDTIPKRRGPAQLVIEAYDHSWRGLFAGNTTIITHDITVKFRPPRLEAVSTPSPVSQGGTGLVMYRVSEDATRHGVQIGEAFFPGYHNPGEAFGMFSIFAFPHHAPVTTPVNLVADDGLGNHGTRQVSTAIIPKTWRIRRLNISDQFIERTIMPVIDRVIDLQYLDTPLDNFLQVNNILRQRNTDQLTALASQSRHEFLWQGPFLQLSNSQVEAAFADHRHYLYQGKVVDTQDHLGFDLAVTAHYPVEAANDGEVVLAEYLGIYGNAVVIDHGYGLQSLYAHLSSLETERGAVVRKGHIIGKSGMTGLAVGDHLHFSMLLHGVQINPLEWWDSRWVQSRITDHLRTNAAVDPASLLQPLAHPTFPPSAPRPTL